MTVEIAGSGEVKLLSTIEDLDLEIVVLVCFQGRRFDTDKALIEITESS
ncbi:MAG: hypothetical protein ACMUEM_07825 [Flavobacteriales bacterium AspAUS03]